MSGNSGFDWNRNGKADAFDHFMTMKVATKLPLSAEGFVHKKKGSQANGIAICRKIIYDAKKDSNGVVILKSIFVISLCVAGIFIPVITEMEGIAVVLFPLGAVGASVLMLRNT